MKKIVSAVLGLVFILSLVSVVHAESKEIDLSGMTYDELVALKDRINLAIWESDEWQEVEVPQGVWKVGDDIPAGKWTIKALPNLSTYVKMGMETKNGGTEVNHKVNQDIYDPGYRFFKEGSDITEWTIELEEGMYVQIDWGSAVFMPYAGKPSLGFKK